MDEVATMTVPPTLPPKAQARDASQVARQTVSIRTVSNPPTATLSTGAGATVFVGLGAPGVDSAAACRRRIPEVQSANGYGKQNSVKPTVQQSQQQQQSTQQQQQAAHVVKIRINPDGDKNGRVISTVRLTLDENVGHEVEQENGIACERSSKRDGGVVVSATNLVNEQHCGSAGEACVRISVGCNAFERNNNNNNEKRNRNNDGSEKDMVQRDTSDTLNNSSANNRSSACFYYNNTYQSPLAGMVMSSGQCSPSDTLDSGTCSDLDGTPPPLPKKKNASTVTLASEQHKRTGSLTSSGAEVDSDDNESNISCDSLNAGDLHDSIESRNANESIRASPDFQDSFQNGDVDHSAKDTVLNLNRLDLSSEGPMPPATTPEVESNSRSTSVSLSVSPSPSAASTLSKASSTPRIRSPDPVIELNGKSPSPMVKECTYEERKQEQERIEQESAGGDVDASINPVTGKKYLYEYDRFYKFHVNELKGNNKDASRGVVLGDKDTDECFAGYKILDKEAIRSAKGTVRGVKNRVRAGIATFLQKPSSQAYIKKELGKVVVYTTTSGIVRKTFYNCKKVKQILRTHMVKYDELDLFGDAELQGELRDRLGLTAIQLPQLFIDGQHIGGFDTVERLNESGELRDMLKPYQSDDACTVCLFCGGYQWQLCPVCNGSKRSVHRNDFTAEFVALKCAKCDVNGLIRCPHC
ncbi:glutaredoxin domain-containing cysteine-rich protein CG12206-like [Hylaeus anthracinus]|uniref:glutaredoxin domain-containing cysteine-rich protein CG12206-like n=1 Tax=Hylaeus anthracinus TaxID=313031 RepID=UPI0023B92323|nr:glutaredoxin domain-containing cysteine-rich protein CG12206-like [Hylaeus anthracinus]XP_054015146.1 glutaredoxin domain-containing cysteine-rich protein CG12206-like [Hylaeus anthracinus]